jgi:hypothetical protein
MDHLPCDGVWNLIFSAKGYGMGIYKRYHIFAKIDHVTPYILRAKSGLYDYVERGIKAVINAWTIFQTKFF